MLHKVVFTPYGLTPREKEGTMRIGKMFRFEAAHMLPDHPGLCRNLHGHSYRVEVVLDGNIQSNGMVMDFGDLSKLWEERCGHLDHSYLNDIGGLEIPTAENLVLYIVARLAGGNLSRFGVTLQRVRVWETETAYTELEVPTCVCS